MEWLLIVCTMRCAYDDMIAMSRVTEAQCQSAIALFTDAKFQRPQWVTCIAPDGTVASNRVVNK